MASEYDGGGASHDIANIVSVADYSIVFNVMPTALQDTKSAFNFDNYPTSPRNQYGFKPSLGGNATFDVGVGNTGDLRTGSSLSVGTVYTVAVTRSGTTLRCYIDGSQVGADVTVGSASFTAENIRFGCHHHSGSNTEYCPCTLSEFAWYNVMLSAAEVTAMTKTRCPRTVRQAGLIRYIPFIRDLVELISGATVNVNSGTPTIATHHPVIYPKRRVL